MVVKFKNWNCKGLYKDAEILILDEATSAFDTVTEKSLISISDLKNKMTLITITHRLSTLEKCDQIVELKNGKVLPIKLENNGNNSHLYYFLQL